jgi:hypothetical protein
MCVHLYEVNICSAVEKKTTDIYLLGSFYKRNICYNILQDNLTFVS